MSDAYTPPQYTEYTTGKPLTEAPNTNTLAEQGKSAGTSAAYANGMRGSTQENRSAVASTADQVRVNPLDNYVHNDDISLTDKQDIETHVKNDDIATFSKWVQEYIIANIHTAAKGGQLAEQRRLTLMLSALNDYMNYVKKYADLAKHVPDIDAKIKAVANSNMSRNLAGVPNISNNSYDLDVTKKYGFNQHSNVQQTIANGIDLSNKDALVQSFMHIGQELAKLYMAAIMFTDADSANAAYNQFMNGYDYAMSRVQHTGRNAAHNLITYYFYSALVNEPNISDDDLQLAHNMAMKGKSFENALIGEVTSGNARVTDNQDPAVPNTTAAGTTSDRRIKHIRALGGWLPAMTRR